MKLKLEEYLEKQKKEKYRLPEKVMLTNNREIGFIVGWEPSDKPEYVTIELHPQYSNTIKGLTIRTSFITRVEEKHKEDKKEYWIWISHHKLATELSQELVKRIIMGIGK